MDEGDYNIALVEAGWYTAHPPQNPTNQDYVNRLIKDLTAYEEEHGLESYELRELKAQEDAR